MAVYHVDSKSDVLRHGIWVRMEGCPHRCHEFLQVPQDVFNQLQEGDVVDITVRKLS